MIGVVVMVAVVFICNDSKYGWGEYGRSSGACLSGVYTGSGSNMGVHGVGVVVPEVVPAYHIHYHRYRYYMHVCK